jgi:hypothetical protein
VQDTQLLWCSMENAHKLHAINLEGRGILGNLGFIVQSPDCDWIRSWRHNTLVSVPCFYKRTTYQGMGRITLYSRMLNSLASYKLLHLFQEHKDPFSKKIWINGVIQLATLFRHWNEIRKKNRKRLRELGQRHVNQPHKIFKFFVVLNKTIFPYVFQATAKCRRGRLQITHRVL